MRVCEKPRRTGTKTSRSADRSPVLPLRAASLPTRLLLIVLLRFCNDGRGGGNAGRSREDFSHGATERKKKLPLERQADAAPRNRSSDREYASHRFGLLFDCQRVFRFVLLESIDRYLHFVWFYRKSNHAANLHRVFLSGLFSLYFHLYFYLYSV